MKNFRIINLAKLNDVSNFGSIEDGIYKDLNDQGGFATYRIAMAMDPEEGDTTQYPLEDILDKFFVHVQEFLESDASTQKYILGGELDDIRNLKSIIGKRAFNEEFVDEKGKRRIRLKIE